jgi:hypothetical protein
VHACRSLAGRRRDWRGADATRPETAQRSHATVPVRGQEFLDGSAPVSVQRFVDVLTSLSRTITSGELNAYKPSSTAQTTTAMGSGK